MFFLSGLTFWGGLISGGSREREGSGAIVFKSMTGVYLKSPILHNVTLFIYFLFKYICIHMYDCVSKLIYMHVYMYILHKHAYINACMCVCVLLCLNVLFVLPRRG